MNIKSLQLFSHLCTSKNFSKTANAMHISPSALSRQIQKLEHDVGHKLLERDNRSVELTNAGKTLLPVALDIHTTWTQYKSAITDDDKDLHGEIRLFCSVTASFSHLPDLLTDFRLTYPNIELKLLTGDPAKAINVLLKNEADIVISALPEPLPAKLEFAAIGDIPLSVIAPIANSSFHHEIEKRHPNWQAIPFIIPNDGTARDRANDWFKVMKIKPDIYAQVEGHEGIVSMVALGLGVGIVPDIVINNSPVKDKIRKLIVTPIEPFKLGICCQKSQLDNPLVQALWRISQPKFIKI